MSDKVLAGLIVALVAVAGSAVGVGYVSDSREAQLKSDLSTSFNSASFRLEGAHAVTATYEGRNYTYNFDNNTVLAGQVRGVGFGGAGYGGLVSFDNFADKNAIEVARQQGCKIAGHMTSTAENPGWPVNAEFTDARRKAVQYIRSHCQP